MLFPILFLTDEAVAQTSDEVVLRDVIAFIDIYGFVADTVYVSGLTTYQWGERYFNGVTDVIDTELIDANLHGELTGFCISFQQHPSLPSPGKVEFPGPGADFPAESFFDVYFEVTIPDLMPMDTLHTIVPIHISDIIDEMTPYFSPHIMTPPGAIILYDQWDTPRGEISFWEEEMIEYSPAEAFVTAETSFGTDIAIAHDDTIMLSAAVAGYIEPLPGVPACIPTIPFSAEFGIKENGMPGPFSSFYVDLDGAGWEIGAIDITDEGDGWAGYLDIGPYSPSGGYYDIEVIFNYGLYDLRDTITLYIDPTSIVPEFVAFSRDSVAFFEQDAIGSIIAKVMDEVVNGVNLVIHPLAAAMQREIEPINQHHLTTNSKLGDILCGPASAAACLKFWAKNGYPEIEHPKGDTTKTKLTNRRIGRSLAHNMGMSHKSKSAPKVDEIVGGIEKYLEKHKCKKWKVERKDVNDLTDVATMMREFETENEDVIMIMSDTITVNDTLRTRGHAVTMSSRKSEVYKKSVNGTDSLVAKQKVDFMDPDDGTTGATNEHEIGVDEKGHPRTEGYTNINENFNSNSRISGYIKVSPPDTVAGGGSPPARTGWHGQYHMPQEYAMPTYGDWIIVDSRPCSGNGIPDTLYWDTTGFPGGLYLLEVRTTDMYGNVGTALRFAGIPEYIVDSNEPEVPPVRTDIRSSYPNPFNPTTTIEYSVSKRTSITMSVYDVSGRLVSVLFKNKTEEAGIHKTVWDGMNSSGSRVASGVYFAVIKSEDGLRSRKMILLR
ncbi:MAG: T9SS type A sorting domain-containing protein [Candidatus Krumholzibacteria bacterium]|nr:T9SS type A sorting domain-containing protein [Candidatus Krumholzibacteria bacterium]